MPQYFAQLSDPHLSSLENIKTRDILNKRALGYLSWLRKRRFEHQTDVLEALQRDLEQSEFKQLLITGDLTHIGLPMEFEQARSWLTQLGEPGTIALVPGNHDACVAAPWADTFALWQDYMAPDTTVNTDAPTTFPTLRIRDSIAFIGLSTACPKPPLMATGTVGPEQLARLPAVLEDTADKGLFRVVYLHHCPVAGQEKWRKRLTDAAGVQAVLEDYGAELVLHGHGHRKHFSELQSRHGQVPVIAVPSASALGLHGADVAQYNHYQVQRVNEGWQLDINSRCYDTRSGEFGPGESKTLLLNR